MHPTLRLRSSLPRTISQTLKLPISSSASLPNTTIHGWVSSIRAKKKIAFVEVRDGTSSRPVQVVVKGAKEEDGLRRCVAAQDLNYEV
jgi:aspartyl/asparaginyl-tRNA synthetase